MSADTWTATSPPPCPVCGAGLIESSSSDDESGWTYRCPDRDCGWEDGGGYDYERLTMATAPWTRALWAEIERLLALRAPAATPPVDLTFARQVAPGLAWQDNGVEVFAELPTGRAIPGDGHVTVGSHWVYVVVGGYKLRRNPARPLTIAEARHVLHDFGQRLARSTLDYRRAAGMAILVGMGER